MKTIITLLLSCASVLATDTDIRVVSTSRTNIEAAAGTRKDIFTRGGQTNLVSLTRMNSDGVVRICRFYHAGQLVGNFVALPEESIFNTEAGPYCMSLKYGPAGEIRSARIGDKQGVLLDEFIFTNGNFCPIEGPLRQNVSMKPKFYDESKFIRETAESEARFKKQATGKDGPTNQ
jgi:hypothetical protein